MHLMQRLMERLNSEVFEISYTFIASYLIKHHSRISEITIEEICEVALVSKSTLRRFCNSIGYRNFSELKKSYQLSRTYQNEEYDDQVEIPKILEEVHQTDRLKIDKLIEMIQTYEDVFVLVPYDLYSCFYEFQKEMMYRQKTIFLVPNIDLHFKEVKRRMEKGLILIIDVDSTYLEGIIPFLNQIDSTCVLFTNHQTPLIDASLSFVFKDYKFTSLKKYQLMFFLDLILRFYPGLENV